MSPPREQRKAVRGVLSVPDDEAIEKWKRVPPEERLRWLAEANEFLYLAQPPSVRQVWEAFRRGEV